MASSAHPTALRWLLALGLAVAGCGDPAVEITGNVDAQAQATDDVQAAGADADTTDATPADIVAPPDAADAADAATATDVQDVAPDAPADEAVADLADAATPDVAATDVADAAPDEWADAVAPPDAATEVSADAPDPDDAELGTDAAAADDATDAESGTDAASPDVVAGCVTPADCPTPSAACQVAVCHADGSCGSANATDGATCDDGKLCTGPDGCVAGLCTGATVTCEDGNVCTYEACFPVGGCVWLPAPGTCSDGDACTVGESCVAKTCGGSTPLVCNDDNPCTDDACAKDFGCTFLPNAATCSDGTDCTTGDHCEGGVCSFTGGVDCNDGEVCTTDSCSGAGVCAHVANALSCDDGSACTSADACLGGTCKGTAITCVDGWPCTADSCNPTSGCVYTPDNSLCNDTNPCTADTCSTVHGCLHPAIDGPCTDGDSCTANDTCVGGNCKPGSPTNCNDNNVCTTEYCDSAQGGCVYQALAITCDDGLACTVNDACVGKVCQGTAANCDDGNACTTDACDATAACSHTAIAGGTCDDASACTSGDHCVGTVCTGTAKSCDDGNACTTDTCNAFTAACGHVTLNSGACDDGNGCTTGETCVAGVCTAALTVSTVSTIAGSGSVGGQDGPGSSASFNTPYGGARMPDGSLVVSDTLGARIRLVQSDGTVSTIAGTGVVGSADGAAASATFYGPKGLSADAAGTVFIADASNHRIRKLSGGQVTTFAGSSGGFKDGIGSAAQFYQPTDVRVGSNGVAWVADEANNRLRRITPDGTVTTAAGTGTAGSADGPVATAQLNAPTRVAIAADGGVFLFTSGDFRIRKLSADGQTVSTLAGTTSGYLDGAGASAKFGAVGGLSTLGPLLLVSDRDASRIRVVAPDGTVNTLAGSGTLGYLDGAPSSAAFAGLNSLTPDAIGNVWIADGGNNRIRKLTFTFPICNDGNVCTTDACASNACTFTKLPAGATCSDGTGCTTSDACTSAGACVGTPQNCDDANACTTDYCNPLTLGCSHIAVVNWLACDDGSVCTTGDTCFYGNCIASPIGTVSTIAGSGSAGFLDGVATSAQFNGPRGVIATKDGGLLVTDTYNARIRKIDTSGTVTTIAGSGIEGDQDGAASSAQFREPHHMLLGPDGTLYLTEWLGNRIRVISTSGTVTTLAGSTTAQSGFVNGTGTNARFANTTGLVFAANGDLLVADYSNHAIRRVTLAGAVSTFAGGNGAGGTDGPALTAKITNPTGLASDTAGNVYVAETGGNRIRRIDASGVVSTLLGDGTGGFSESPGIAAKLNGPWDILWHPNGYLVFSENYGERVRAVWPDGTNTTLAGNGTQGYIDGGGANAVFNYPEGLALMANGAIAVVDGSGHRIRQITPSAIYCNDNNPCTTDACGATTGLCVFTPVTSGGGSCDDGNACTTDGCNSSTGACGHTPVADGSVPCTDNNLCTTGESCLSGQCGGSSATNCDDNNPCTTDSCAPSNGCSHVTLAKGASCGGTGKLCDAGGVCQTTVCGNSVCESAEQCNVCVTDCGQCGPWSFGGMTGFNHSVGQQFSGDSWYCEGSGCNDYLGWGPYIKVVGPGQHSAVWTLLLDGTYSYSTVVAHLDVNDAAHGQILASTDITLGQGVPLGNWHTFTLYFTVPQGASLEFRTWDTGYYDYFGFNWQKVVLGRVDVY